MPNIITPIEWVEIDMICDRGGKREWLCGNREIHGCPKEPKKKERKVKG